MGVIADNDILIKDIIGDEQNEGEFTLVLPKANGSENNPRFAIVGKLKFAKTFTFYKICTSGKSSLNWNQLYFHVGYAK